MKLRKEQDVTQSYVNQRRLILNGNTSFHIQEAYRTLQTNIRFSLPGNGCKVIELGNFHGRNRQPCFAD